MAVVGTSRIGKVWQRNARLSTSYRSNLDLAPALLGYSHVIKSMLLT